MSIFSSSPNPGEDKGADDPSDSWTIAQGTNNGPPMFLRINLGLKQFAGKAAFDHRFGVAVPFHAPDENGLPTKDESKELSRIEDTLTETLARSGKTLFAFTITTSGFREFVFYTCVPKEIIPVLERIKTEITSHVIQFYVEPDPNWEVYQDYTNF